MERFKKTRILPLIIVGIIAVGTIIKLISSQNLSKEPYKTPNINDLEKIVLTDIVDRNPVRERVFTDKEVMEKFSGVLSQSENIRNMMSVSEVPNSEEYAIIQYFFKSGGDSRHNIYNENGKQYIEVPYYKIYEMKKEGLEDLTKIMEKYEGIDISNRPITGDPSDIRSQWAGIINMDDFKFKPDITYDTNVGVEVMVDSESENYLVFHGYFGLFVYDLKNNKMVGSLDLKPIDCQKVQGDNACMVSFNESEMIARIWPADQKDVMYEYNILKDSLRRIPYDESLILFTESSGRIIEAAGVGDLVYSSSLRKYRIFDAYFAEGYTVKKGLYENKKDITDYGNIRLEDNGQYIANLGYIYSYAPRGSYRQDGDRIICYNEDEVIMKFRIEGDILVYDGELEHFEVGERFYLGGE